MSFYYISQIPNNIYIFFFIFVTSLCLSDRCEFALFQHWLSINDEDLLQVITKLVIMKFAEIYGYVLSWTKHS